jgi:hypothetical protein
MLIDLDPLALILLFLNQFSIASRLVCSLCDAMATSPPMASTAVLLAKVAVIDSGEVGRSAAYHHHHHHHHLFTCQKSIKSSKLQDIDNSPIQHSKCNKHMSIY